MTLPRPIGLLPFERELARLLGVSEETYRAFRAETASKTRIDPAKPVAGGAALSFALNLVVGVGFSLLASLFKPKPPGKPPTIDVRQISGGNITENERRAPRYGFNSTQEIARAGQRYPLVIARRRLGANGRWYGGVRVNLLLLWSQMLSQKGDQLFKAIFLLGRRDMGNIDPREFAFGDTTLVSYDWGATANDRSARYAMYASINGGRLTTNDWVAGINPYRDVANGQNFGGTDVYCYRGYFGAVQNGFCCTARPSTGTSLGLFSPIPNGMAFRIAPRMRPTCTCQIRTRSGGNYFIECEDDTAALAEFYLSKYFWSVRSGLRKRWHNGNTTTPASGSNFDLVEVDVEDLLTYTISAISDANTKIRMYEGNTDADDNDSETVLDCTTVSSGVSGIQNSADSALQIGSLYKIGSALAVLESRNPNSPFVSEADNEPVGDGRTVDYRFRVVREGTVGFIGAQILNPPETGTTIVPPYYNRDDNMADISSGRTYRCATQFPQIFRCAVASFGVARPTKMIEIGFRHTLGIKVNGFTNLRSCPDLRTVNNRAGQNRSGDSVGSSTKLNSSIFQSGVITKREERYAFYSIWFRDGYDQPWDRFGDGIFGFCSSSGEPCHEYMRIQFPYVSADWQIMLEPMSGWQVRTNEGWNGDLLVIDGNVSAGSRTDNATGIRIDYNGYQIEIGQMEDAFALRSIDAKEDIGYGFIENNSMIDPYGKLAEMFIYSEITTTVDSGPEIEIAYVNVFSDNTEQADYDDLAIIGVNVWGNSSLKDLNQASLGVGDGYMMRRLLESDSYGPSNLFPDLVRELMTSPWLGNGLYITDAQIDLASFQAAAQWCLDRYYFYDAVITEPVNLLTWITDVGATHLLQLVKRGSLFGLRPALVFGQPVPISGLFTAGNILEQTFEITIIPFEERQPIAAIGKYREQSPSLTGYQPGLFPVDKTVFVREQGRPDTDPIEEFDLSSYCTSEQHLIDALCFIIRRRRLVDHAIRFSTTPVGLTASLASGDYIQVAYDLIYFDQYAHGVITNEGQLVTTRPDLMTPGTHTCLTWDGSDVDPIEQTVTVNNDETASPAGIMFALKQVSQELRTYEITRIQMDREGVVTIEASYHPCDENGYSLLAANWTTYNTDANWEIRR